VLIRFFLLLFLLPFLIAGIGILESLLVSCFHLSLSLPYAAVPIALSILAVFGGAAVYSSK